MPLRHADFLTPDLLHADYIQITFGAPTCCICATQVLTATDHAARQDEPCHMGSSSQPAGRREASPQAEPGEGLTRPIDAQHGAGVNLNVGTSSEAPACNGHVSGHAKNGAAAGKGQEGEWTANMADATLGGALACYLDGAASG